MSRKKNKHREKWKEWISTSRTKISEDDLKILEKFDDDYRKETDTEIERKRAVMRDRMVNYHQPLKKRLNANLYGTPNPPPYPAIRANWKDRHLDNCKLEILTEIARERVSSNNRRRYFTLTNIGTVVATIAAITGIVAFILSL
jgi:hypothetical protein